MTLSTTLTIIISSFILTVILAPIGIPLLRRLKFGQSIREEGPKSHMKKAGTPTMGGLIFLLAIIISTIAVAMIFDLFTTQTVVLLLVLVGFGIIGFLDDGLKVIFKRNLGLTSLQKLIGQIAIAIAAFLLLRLGSFDTAVSIPYTDISIDLGVFFVAFLIFWLVGSNQMGMNFLWFTVIALALSFLMTVIYLSTKSIFLCIIFHALINSFWEVYIPDTNVLSALFTLLFALVIFTAFEFYRKKNNTKAHITFMDNNV